MSTWSGNPGNPGGAGGPRGSSPVVRFLGHGALDRGPFSLLGIQYADTPNDEVMAALEMRLATIDAHPEGLTPQADEVRLALHAAAAQLLDAGVRLRMAERWGIRTGWVATGRGASNPRGPSAGGPGPERAGLERDAVLTLAMYGGWNVRVLRRLTMLAHSRGLSSAVLADVLLGLSRRPPSAPPIGLNNGAGAGHVAAPPKPPIRTEPERPTLRSVMETIAPDVESDRLVKRTVLFAGAVLLVLVVAIAAVTLLTAKLAPGSGSPNITTPGPSPSKDQSKSSEMFTTPTDRSGDKESGKTAKPSASNPAAAKEAPAVTRELAAAAEGLGIDAQTALSRFEAAVGVFASEWGHYPDDQLRAAQDTVIEFLYKSAPWSDVTTRAIEAVRAPVRALRPGASVPTAAQIWPAAWSLGMLTRLEAEKDLPPAARLAVQSELQASVPGRVSDSGAEFSDGVWAAINLMPRMLLPPHAPAPTSPSATTAPPAAAASASVDAWREWIAVTKAVAGHAPERRSKALLSALETVMVSGPDPGPGNDVEQTITLLVGELTWRENDESRRWMMRWFSAPGVSARDLHAVTMALVSKASAPGVDATMVLADSAGEGQREELRDRFARAWTLTDLGDRADIAAEWTKACRTEIDASKDTADPLLKLASAVVFSRLNQAAQLIWNGQRDLARELIAGAAEGTNLAGELAKTHPDHLGEGGDDAVWAVKYIQVDRNIPERLKLLADRAQRGGTIGQVEAAVIATEALKGSPESVRRGARDVVKRFSSDPAMINGLLEEVPTIPITNDNAQLIRSVTGAGLPGLSDSRWREAVRRTLVERLLEALAAQGELGLIDRLTEILAESYQARTTDGAAPADSPGKKGTVPPAEDSVRLIRLRWQAAASAAIPSGREPLSPDQIARRNASRLSLADGMVQKFAADQISLCEYMAFVIASEHPSQAEPVTEIMNRLAESRRHARHILEQIGAVEQAMSELWLVRLEGGKT